jgi:hypothetical protein
MGPTGYPETSGQNYHSTLRNTPEERISHLHRGGRLKSRKTMCRGQHSAREPRVDRPSTLKLATFKPSILVYSSRVDRIFVRTERIFLREQILAE